MLVMAQPTSERFWTTNLWLSVERDGCTQLGQVQLLPDP